MVEQSNGVTIGDLRYLLQDVRHDKGTAFMARCPAHDDKNPSLSVKQTATGILLHCFAGCSFEEICSAMDLAPSGFAYKPGVLGDKKSKVAVDVYDYLDEHGGLLYQVVRHQDKSFHCRRPDGGGGWEYNLNGVEKVLYRLPDLKAVRESLGGPPVFIVEGEKDVETLASLGLTATCNPHGAGKWRDSFAESLQGLDCVIIPDNDDAGRAHAESVAASILPRAKSVKVLELPDLPEKGDVTDWAEVGHTKEELLTLAAACPPSQPKKLSIAKKKVTAFEFTSLRELLMEPLEATAYVVDDLSPTGALSMLAGKPKSGKSTLARNLAMSVAKGEPFAGRGTRKGLVIYLCLEEKRAELNRQFRNMGASEEEILVHTGTPPEGALERLEAAIVKHRPALVIIDPLSRILRVPDFNDYATMTRALEPLLDMAREHGTHIVVLHHNNKGSQESEDAVLGSTALFGTVDTLVQVRKREGMRTIVSTNRYGQDLPETVIVMDKETGLVTTKGERKAILNAEKRMEILDCFAIGEELAELEIKSRVAGPGGVVSSLIRQLCEEGKLVRLGAGGKGDPYRYRRPGDPPPGTRQLF